jgi:hypothetical protein
MPTPCERAAAQREQTLFSTFDSPEKATISHVFKPHGPIDEKLVT